MFVDDKKIIGNKIKQYRKLRNFTQAALAEAVNISEKHLSKIETGVHYPSIGIFFGICEILEIPVEEFSVKLPVVDANPKREELMKYILAVDETELEYILSLVKFTYNNYKINRKQK